MNSASQMTKKDAERIARLRKRADHLSARIISSATKDLSFDRAELSALRWAIERLSAQPSHSVDRGEAVNLAHNVLDGETYTPLAVKHLAEAVLRMDEALKEHICKCGIRVTPHRCAKGSDF